MPCFAVRLEVLLMLNADREWKKRFMQAKSLAEMQKVICDFGEAKGFKIVEVQQK